MEKENQIQDECICVTGAAEWSGYPNPENPDNEWICDSCGRIHSAEEKK